MRDVFADRWRTAKAAGTAATLRLVANTVADTVRHGFAERRSARRARTKTMLRSISSDIRFGVRRLRRRPAFAQVALLTLGLGIGAATSVFTVANAVVLRALPYAGADRLV